MWVQLARTLFRAGRLDAAQTRLEQVADLNPASSPQSGFNLGVVRLQNTQAAAARTAFRRAVQFDPDLVEGHMQLGRLASKAHRTKEALQHVRRAIATDSSPAEAYGRLGIMYVRTNPLTRARRMFERVLERDPQNTAARRLLRKLSP